MNIKNSFAVLRDSSCYFVDNSLHQSSTWILKCAPELKMELPSRPAASRPRSVVAKSVIKADQSKRIHEESNAESRRLVELIRVHVSRFNPNIPPFCKQERVDRNGIEGQCEPELRCVFDHACAAAAWTDAPLFVPSKRRPGELAEARSSPEERVLERYVRRSLEPEDHADHTRGRERNALRWNERNVPIGGEHMLMESGSAGEDRSAGNLGRQRKTRPFRREDRTVRTVAGDDLTDAKLR